MEPTRLAIDWTKHLKPDKKESFELAIRNSTIALTRLSELLEEYEAELGRWDLDPEDMGTSEWSHRQACRIGERRAYNRLKNLLNFTHTRRPT